MKELKGIDETTAIKINSIEERDKCLNLFVERGHTIDFTRDGDYIFTCKDCIFTHNYLDDETVITAADFIRLNTEPTLPTNSEEQVILSVSPDGKVKSTIGPINWPSNGLFNGTLMPPINLPNTPEIPERWCVRRTPENAEVLNAWSKYKVGSGNPTGASGYMMWDGWFNPTEPDYPEITTEQWQTIPEVAEWLNQYNWEKYCEEDAANDVEQTFNDHLNTEKVEEREIIGYKALFDLDWGITSGKTYEMDKSRCEIGLFGLYSDIDSNGKMWIPINYFIGTNSGWEPVYREVPKFKVGDWVTVKQGNHDEFKTFQIGIIDENMIVYKLSNFVYYSADNIRLATPEEIEAARQKRKYMKQVWYVLVMEGKNLNCISVSNPFHSEEEANAWTLEVSEEGRVYSVKPFEVVAYEQLRKLPDPKITN